MIRLLLFPPLICTVVLCTDADAQQAGRLTADANFGVSAGGGGAFVHRRGAALETLVAFGVRDMRSGALIGGLAAGMQGSLAVTDICQPDPEGGCIPDFPALFSAGVFLGQHWPIGTASSRIMVGPAYYWGTEGQRSPGVRARVDAASPPLGRLAVVASLSGALLRDFGGDRLRTATLGLGLRIQ